MPDRYFNFDSSSKSNQKSKTLSRDKIMKNRQILDKYFLKIVLDWYFSNLANRNSRSKRLNFSRIAFRKKWNSRHRLKMTLNRYDSTIQRSMPLMSELGFEPNGGGDTDTLKVSSSSSMRKSMERRSSR